MTATPPDPGAARVLDGARDDARQLGDAAIGGEHILASLFRRSDLAAGVLASLGLDATRIAETLLELRGRTAKAGRPPATDAAAPPADAPAPDDAALVEAGSTDVAPAEPAPEPELAFTSHARRLVDVAAREARERGVAATEAHYLLAAAREPRGPFARVLNEAKVTPFTLRKAVVRAVDGDAAADAMEEPKRGGQPAAAPASASVAPVQDAAPSAPPADADDDADAAPDDVPARAPVTPAPTPRPERQPKRETAKAATPPVPPKPPRERERDRDRDKDRRDKTPAAAAPARERREGAETREAPRRTGEPTHGIEWAERTGAKPPRIGKLGKRESGPLWRKLLLLAVPASIALHLTHQDPALVFIVTCFAVLPLAGYMGEATEHLAARTGPAIGGLLNATFGNAAELIIAAAALRAGLIGLVKASLIGSILGNLLLILGLSILAGGITRPKLSFNRTGTGMSASMLALAAVGLAFPALLHSVHPDPMGRLSELYLSEVTAGILIVTYAFSLLFSLKTHVRLLGGDPHPTEGATWSPLMAVGVLAIATVFVGVESEILVHATEAVTKQFGLSELFLGLIIIPFIGNAAEHAAAVVVARKGQIDLAFQIALGSSTQIALLVAPILVFLGLAFGQRMDLVFTPFEVLALGLSVIVTSIITLDGESHWFEGVQLLAVYGLVGAAAFFM